MKIVTNDFKEEITKLGREIDLKINLHINDRIITQNGKFLTTENNIKLIVEQFSEYDIDDTINAEDIYNAQIVTNGNLLSTMMKEFDFESREELRIGDIVDCEFGLKVNGEYEYINYGKYVLFSKEFNEDTKTYSYVCFDSMLLSMIEVDDTDIIQNVSVKKAIENICNKVGLNINITEDDIDNLPNLNNIINDGTFVDIEMTYRDVLDTICQCLGISMIVNDKNLILKTFNDNIVDEFDEKYLKDINIKFAEKYGPVNSVTLSRSEDTDIIYRSDEESISNNGLHEFKIKDNLILNYNDREDYIDEIFEQLNGLEFYINDFTSTGITYLDWLDFYNINIGNNSYKCLLLNDEKNITQGLEENIYTDSPEEAVSNYKTIGKTDKEVSFIVDKQRGSINAKVSKGDVINQINLDETGAEINANKISLAGKTIEMTSDNIAINSNKFSVSKEGNITATGGTIGGFGLSNSSFSSTSSITRNYTQSDLNRIQSIIMGNTTPTNNDYERYDLNGDGLITSLDYVRAYKIVNGSLSSTQSCNYLINSNDPVRCITITNNNENAKNVSLGLYGGYIRELSASSINISSALQFFPSTGNSSLINMTASSGNITCVSLTQTSKEESKKNFEKYENALEEIKNTDIYKYNFKNENDNDKKHIGFVIGKNFNYSKDITGIDENNEEMGVDIYSMVSVLWQGVKEQQEQIEKLQKEIKSLKGDDI